MWYTKAMALLNTKSALLNYASRLHEAKPNIGYPSDAEGNITRRADADRLANAQALAETQESTTTAFTDFPANR